MLENPLKLIKSFWLDHETKIVLVFGFILISVISFEMGYIQGQESHTGPIVIEKPSQASEISPEQENNGTIESSSSEDKKPSQDKSIATKKSSSISGECAYVGSRNSDKFYPPDCSYAKRIKPENVVCFKSAEEALSQGRSQSTGCAK
jgi:hypothetical protein